MPLVEHEAEVAPHGGYVAPNRRRRETQVLQVIHILAERLRANAAWRTRARQPRECRDACEVAQGCFVGARRGTFLHGQEIGEGCMVEGAWRLMGVRGVRSPVQ